MRKRRRAAAVQDARALPGDDRTARSVVECARPLALWRIVIFPTLANEPGTLAGQAGDDRERSLAGDLGKTAAAIF
jgi:hypothetical protein